MRLSATVIACLVLASGTGRAQDNAPQNLEPDRPDVTNGTHIVDIGLLQVEAGWQYNHSGLARHDSGTPITMRLGVTDWIELRVGEDGYLSSTSPAGTAQGLGNIQLGAKLRLWADPGGVPVLSILPNLTVPTANSHNGLGSGEADFQVALLTGTDFLTRGHADVNYGIGWIGGGPGLPHFRQHQASISTSAEIPGPVTPYVELYWFSRQDPDGGPVTAVDAGAVYVINPRFALDGGFQRGLSASAPQFSLFGGASVIVGNVLGQHGVHARARESARRMAASHGK